MRARLMKRKLPSGKTALYLDIRSPGFRKREPLGLYLVGDRFQDSETKKLANEVLARRRLTLIQQTHGPLYSIRRNENFVSYLQEMGEAKESPNTRQSWKNAREHFAAFAGDITSFSQVTVELLEGFRTYLLKEKKLSPNSAQIYLSRIKTALHQAVREGRMVVNPAASLSIRKTETFPVHLSIKEVRILAKTPCPNEDVKNAFLFSCFTGLRYSDIARLNRSQIQDGNLEIIQKKTGRPIRNPLSQEAKRVLERQKKITHSKRVTRPIPEGQVFILPRQSTVDKELKQWAKNAKVEKPLSMHKARHTFATLALSSGIDIFTTSKLLGHRNLQTTQIYAKVIDESKKKAVDKLPTLDK